MKMGNRKQDYYKHFEEGAIRHKVGFAIEQDISMKGL